MKISVPSAALILLCGGAAVGCKVDDGFRSIGEYKAADPVFVFHVPEENIDDVFDTRNAPQRLAAEKRVRLFRKQEESDELAWAYYDLERKGSLKDRLGKQLPTVEVAEAAFRPVLELAADFKNYGDKTLCLFEPGVAMILGGDEPDYILVCCFKCHDVHVVRRPTPAHPMPQVAELGMSPEFERAILDLARAAYPLDKDLQSFKLIERKRATTPIKKSDSSFRNNEPQTPSK